MNINTFRVFDTVPFPRRRASSLLPHADAIPRTPTAAAPKGLPGKAQRHPELPGSSLRSAKDVEFQAPGMGIDFQEGERERGVFLGGINRGVAAAIVQSMNLSIVMGTIHSMHVGIQSNDTYNACILSSH
eukprot:TRINITY_DN12259_c0_g1_i1.p1 TRINITY_DN12259_c0_g1~~TRINITY_DN12259_c0_g1_i1.p1  ORF type:complete len:130 (+),score=0.35 TRINITY_DN12259_c0_g1_i1:77-466(+)